MYDRTYVNRLDLNILAELKAVSLNSVDLSIYDFMIDQ